MDTAIFESLITYLFRWGHFLFGVTWIGLLYYFNFVQGEYFKEATADAKSDAVQKLAPRALWWFRWSALFTFVTGIILLAGLGARTNLFIVAGAVMGTLMFINVWAIIWPAQKIVCGIAEGDAATAGPKALLASRTNTLFSGPMLFFMGASAHLGGNGAIPVNVEGASMVGLIASLGIILVLEANAIFGKLGPITSITGVVHCSLALTAVLAGITMFL